jgi:LCP family protein required for cell wall assembly
MYWPRRRRYRLIILLLVLISVGCVLGFYGKPIARLVAKVYLSFKLSNSHLTGQEGARVKHSLSTVSSDPNKSVNTLILGSDAGSVKGESGYSRSDVMMLVCLQERDKKAVVISIPRDTMVQVPGHGTQKINAAHAFSGPSGAIDAVKNLLGIDVHHYISVQFTGFEKIVNALGGIPIHLNQPISDPHSGYLPAGDLKLDGWQALVLVRSRNLPNGDLDRIQSQHAFMEALMAKAESRKSVWKANQLVNIVASNCKMDYTAGQLMDLAKELQGFKPGNVQMITVPGDSPTIGGISYFVQNAPLLAQIMTEVKQNNWLSPDLLAKLQLPSSSPAVVLNAPNADVISVLSGSSSSDWAVPTVARELTLMGHQQVLQGHTKQPLARTTVYYRREALANSQAIIKSVPELSGADVVESAQIPVSYNSPIVIVLGSRFTTPSLVSIYGRICKPAFDFQNLGTVVNVYK